MIDVRIEAVGVTRADVFGICRHLRLTPLLMLLLWWQWRRRRRRQLRACRLMLALLRLLLRLRRRWRRRARSGLQINSKAPRNVLKLVRIDSPAR